MMRIFAILLITLDVIGAVIFYKTSNNIRNFNTYPVIPFVIVLKKVCQVDMGFCQEDCAVNVTLFNTITLFTIQQPQPTGGSLCV